MERASSLLDMMMETMPETAGMYAPVGLMSGQKQSLCPTAALSQVLPPTGVFPTPGGQAVSCADEVDMIERLLRGWQLFDDEEDQKTQAASSTLMECGAATAGCAASTSLTTFGGVLAAASTEQWADELLRRLQMVNGDLGQARCLVLEALGSHASARVSEVSAGRARVGQANRVLVKALRAAAERNRQLRASQEEQEALRLEVQALREQLRQSEQAKSMLQWQLQHVQLSGPPGVLDAVTPAGA